jgi:hypothetical protein
MKYFLDLAMKPRRSAFEKDGKRVLRKFGGSEIRSHIFAT